MAKSYDYQSAFDIIGPVMMGPSSSHTAGAVKIGNSARAILGDIPKNIEIHYYESFAQTHQGHGTDVAIVGGAMGYSTFDNRIKSSLEIAADDGIKIDIIEEEGDSIGQHPNCAYIKSSRNDGRYIEIIGISIGGGTIKIKGIHINGLEVDLNHGLPILTILASLINLFCDIKKHKWFYINATLYSYKVVFFSQTITYWQRINKSNQHTITNIYGYFVIL